MKNARFRSFALAVATLAVSFVDTHHASADPTILNGGFEDPAEATNTLTDVTGSGLPDWIGSSIAGATHEYIINGNVMDLSGRYYGTTPYGNQYLGLNAIRNNSFHSIESQTVTGLVSGQAYALTMYIANLDGASDPKVSLGIEFNADGTGNPAYLQTFTTPVEGPYGVGRIDFVPETLVFTATDNVITFNISNQSKTGTMGIDNVSLSAVPEPTTTAASLLGAGALVGTVIRRRKQRN